MEKLRLKAKIGNYVGSVLGGEIVLLSRNNKQIGWMTLGDGEKYAPETTRLLKAAKGKCVTIEIAIKVVKK